MLGCDEDFHSVVVVEGGIERKKDTTIDQVNHVQSAVRLVSVTPVEKNSSLFVPLV